MNRIFLIAAITLVACFASMSGLLANRPVPRPPAQNPAPAKTAKDKRRVADGLKIIDLLLKKTLPQLNDAQVQPHKLSAPAPIMAFSLKDLQDVLKTGAVADKNRALFGYLKTIHDKFGRVTDVRHLHIIPWSMAIFNGKAKRKRKSGPHRIRRGKAFMPHPSPKAGEYMFHGYLKFDNASGWHHFNIVVSEDKNGNLQFRRFFIMRKRNRPMPLGVKC